MTTMTAHVEACAPVALRADERHAGGTTLRRVHAVGRRIGDAGGAVARWFRAGQLGTDGALELARWSGARR